MKKGVLEYRLFPEFVFKKYIYFFVPRISTVLKINDYQQKWQDFLSIVLHKIKLPFTTYAKICTEHSTTVH